MKYCYLILVVVLISCVESKEQNELKQKSIQKEKIHLSTDDLLKIATYFKKAWNSGMNSMKYQSYLDSALIIKPDSAYLWQQKAMPLYKARKYSLGKPFLKKAVAYDPKSYLNYSGFMKCIFSKEYEESISELLEAKKQFGDSYVMDHTYNFYIGLAFIQLNKFDKAKEYLLKSQKQQFNDFPNDPPEEACHYLDWFYLGVVDYELENFEDSISHFNTSLLVYTNFGDAMYYKAYSQLALGQVEEAKITYKEAFENNQNTINEDNVFYEVYPYQIFHRLSPKSRTSK